MLATITTVTATTTKAKSIKLKLSENIKGDIDLIEKR